uniref:Protein kinase domain-containing protein n=1 Tax=Acrobeloides nanus TaxID=290746 RepID=A0A914DSF1_9BILA
MPNKKSLKVYRELRLNARAAPVSFRVPVYYDYKNLKQIDTGRYGIVVQTVIKSGEKAGTKVVIKKIISPFDNAVHSTLLVREIQILRSLKHENFPKIVEVYTPDGGPEEFDNVYIVMEFAGESLFHRRSRGHKFNENEIIDISFQLFKGLEYLHSKEIVHRDLKLENIAINENNKIKILDLGFARHMANEMTSYVITHLYRPPEILCLLNPEKHYGNYKSAADIWSVGCIIAELYLYHPLFYMGEENDDTEFNEIRKIENKINRTIVHIERIFHLCSTPNDSYLQKVSYPSLQQKVSRLPKFSRQDFTSIFQDPGKYFRQFFKSYINTVYVTPSLDTILLLDKILVIEPDQRISAVDALASNMFLNMTSNSSHSQMISQRTASNRLGIELQQQEQALKKLSIKGIKEFLWNVIKK